MSKVTHQFRLASDVSDYLKSLPDGEMTRVVEDSLRVTMGKQSKLSILREQLQGVQKTLKDVLR